MLNDNAKKLIKLVGVILTVIFAVLEAIAAMFGG